MEGGQLRFCTPTLSPVCRVPPLQTTQQLWQVALLFSFKGPPWTPMGRLAALPSYTTALLLAPPLALLLTTAVAGTSTASTEVLPGAPLELSRALPVMLDTAVPTARLPMFHRLPILHRRLPMHPRPSLRAFPWTLPLPPPLRLLLL